MVPPVGRRWSLDLCVAALVVTASACAFGGATGAPASAPRPLAGAPSDSTAGRAVRSRPPRRVGQSAPRVRTPPSRVDSTALEFAITAQLAHRPLAGALARRTRKPEVADRAAWAVTREAGRLKVSPSLLAAVLLIENRTLDSSAVSSQGAIGLMQVMPIHAGSYGCASADLRSVDANICHGSRLLKTYMVRTKSLHLALRRYNGCVRGANTPRCHRYPARVLRTASRLRREMLTTAADLGVVLPPAKGPPSRKRLQAVPPGQS